MSNMVWQYGLWGKEGSREMGDGKLEGQGEGQGDKKREVTLTVMEVDSTYPG